MSDIGPGLHRDLPFEDYAAIPAINSGIINNWGDVSPLHMHEALLGNIESGDTKDRKFGRAYHCRMLEPERYATDFLVATLCGSQFANGNPCKAPGKFWDGTGWYCGRHKHEDCNEPTDFISIEESARIEAMAERLHNDPAVAMFKRKGWSELSGVYERNGVLCKFRSDRVPEDMDLVIDIKKVQLGKATIEDCKDAIGSNGYFVQAAMNVDGIRAFHPLGLEPRFVWVFIEDRHPHGVQVIVADDQDIQDGRFVIDSTLEDYARHRKAGKFPGYMADGMKAHVGGMPEWKRKQLQVRRQAMEAMS